MPHPSDDDSALPTDLSAAFGELQNLLLERADVEYFLQQVAALTASVLPGSSCGITLRRDDEMATLAQSDELAAAVDEIQYGHGAGPCLEALQTGRVITVLDLAADDRWGDYRIHALAHGVHSSLSVPLTVEDDVRGALNLYNLPPSGFTEGELVRTEAFARQASVALTIVLRNADRAVLESQLREALATRAVIDQAIGVIMGQQRLGSAEAFAILRSASQARNRPLRAIAADLIETITGERPTPGRPFADPRH